MIRLAIVVEGPTEEEFVDKVLANHLRAKGVEPTPILPEGRGGDIKVDRLVPTFVKLTSNYNYVTSLVDFYGFRDKGDDTPKELEQRIHQVVCGKIQRSWNESQLFVYVQRHEFEALLFSDVSIFGEVFYDPSNSRLEALRAIRNRFSTPEDINDSRDTAPSKRIGRLIPGYDKRVNGPELAEKMGLAVIREECPRFNKWLTRLESLGE